MSDLSGFETEKCVCESMPILTIDTETSEITLRCRCGGPTPSLIATSTSPLQTLKSWNLLVEMRRKYVSPFGDNLKKLLQICNISDQSAPVPENWVTPERPPIEFPPGIGGQTPDGGEVYLDRDPIGLALQRSSSHASGGGGCC